MSRFLENAAEIFNAAERSLEAGLDPSEMTILIDAVGGIRLVADCDWPLDSLQRERGASMAYRISRKKDAVRLEGREGSRTCVLETVRTVGATPRLPADPPGWLLRQHYAR